MRQGADEFFPKMYRDLSFIQDKIQADVSMLVIDAGKDPMPRAIGRCELVMKGPFITGSTGTFSENLNAYMFRIFTPYYFTRTVREKESIELLPLRGNVGFRFKPTSRSTCVKWVRKLREAGHKLNLRLAEKQVLLCIPGDLVKGEERTTCQCTIDDPGIMLINPDAKKLSMKVQLPFDDSFGFSTICERDPYGYFGSGTDAIRTIFFTSSSQEVSFVCHSDDLMFCSICNMYLRLEHPAERTMPLDFAMPFPERASEQKEQWDIEFLDNSHFVFQGDYGVGMRPCFQEPRSRVSLHFDMPIKRRVIAIHGQPLKLYTMPSRVVHKESKFTRNAFMDELDQIKKSSQVVDFSDLKVGRNSPRERYEAPSLQLNSDQLLDYVQNNALFSKDTRAFLEEQRFDLDGKNETDICYGWIAGRKALTMLVSLVMKRREDFLVDDFLQLCALVTSILIMNTDEETYIGALRALVMQNDTLRRLFDETRVTKGDRLFDFVFRLVVCLFQNGNIHLFFVLLLNNRTWRVKHLRAPNILHSEYFLEHFTSQLAKFIATDIVQQFDSVSQDEFMKMDPVSFSDDIHMNIRLMTARILENGFDSGKNDLGECISPIYPFSELLVSFLREGFKKHPTAIMDDLRSPWYLVQISTADLGKSNEGMMQLVDIVRELSLTSDSADRKLEKLIHEGFKRGSIALWFLLFARAAAAGEKDRRLYEDGSPILQKEHVLSVVDCLLALQQIWTGISP